MAKKRVKDDRRSQEGTAGQNPPPRAGAEQDRAGTWPFPAWFPAVLYGAVTLLLFRKFVFSGQMLLGQDTLSLGFVARDFFAQALAAGELSPSGTPSSWGEPPSWTPWPEGTPSIPPPSSCSSWSPSGPWGGSWSCMSSPPASSPTDGSEPSAGPGRPPSFAASPTSWPPSWSPWSTRGTTGSSSSRLSPPFCSGPPRGRLPGGVSGPSGEWPWSSAWSSSPPTSSRPTSSFGAVGVYAAVRAFLLWRAGLSPRVSAARFGLFLAFSLLGAGVSAIQLLPAVSYVTEFSRRTATTTQASEEGGVAYSSSWSLHPEEVASLVVPEFVGNSAGGAEWATGTYWGRNVFKLQPRIRWPGGPPPGLPGLLRGSGPGGPPHLPGDRGGGAPFRPGDPHAGLAGVL